MTNLPDNNRFPFLATLNEQQRLAVEYDEGPSMIVAGAGSGKTTTLTTKIAYLVAKGVAPWNILALTFTNKAAREMRNRIEGMIGTVDSRSLWMGTFHSIFSRMLRQECGVFGFNSNYTIYKPSDTKSLLKSIVNEMELDDKEYKPSTLAARISLLKNDLMDCERYAREVESQGFDRQSKMPDFGKVYTEYCRRCRTANAMDFDDILLYTFMLFRTYPAVREKYAGKFKYVLVDEYQDTNRAQAVILALLTYENRNICVVGDDAQSIYSFRGARVDNILNFEQTYEGTKIFYLEQNYRSTQNIVNAANSVISKNQNQIKKTIFSKKEEGSPILLNEVTSDVEEGMMVCNRIKKLHKEGVAYKEIAVLYRTNGQSRIFEKQLRKNAIPYTLYGSNSFYDRAEIRDVMGYLRLIVNPNDEEALRRIINYPARGIGKTTVNKIFACAKENNTLPWNVVQAPEVYDLDVNSGAKTKLRAFASMIKNLIEEVNVLDAYQMGERVLRESGLMEMVKLSKDVESKEILDNYSSLLSDMSQFVENKREEGEPFSVDIINYLSEIALLTDSDKDTGNDGDTVSIMTIHIAKGLEFDVVFVTGMEQDVFPSFNCVTEREREEERRLFFVAITRAKKLCYLSNAKTRFRFGKTEGYDPSEFLSDIDSRYIYKESNSFGGRRQNNNEYVGYEESEYDSFVNRVTRSFGSSYDDYSFGRERTQRKPSLPTRETRSLPAGNFKRVATRKKDDEAGNGKVESLAISSGVLTPGCQVEHAVFGKGIVNFIEDGGASLGPKVSISFVNGETKQLLMKYAASKIKVL